MKRLLSSIIAIISLFPIAVNAQIGYQVSLLNSATGKPRANETVNADIKITDSKDGVIYSGTQSVTSNDFGILSFTIGNNTTFQDLATRTFPLYIAVTINGVLIGKSQILSVPMAEVAKSLKSDINLDELCKTWKTGDRKPESYLTFFKDGTVSYRAYYSGELSDSESYDAYYDIEGNKIIIYVEDEFNSDVKGWVREYRIKNGMLFVVR